MARRAKVRRFAKKVIKKPKVIHSGKDISCVDGLCDVVKVKVLLLDCMYGCGNKIRTVVNEEDIIPHLGKPRGLRLKCHACGIKYSNTGLLSGHETCTV